MKKITGIITLGCIALFSCETSNQGPNLNDVISELESKTEPNNEPTFDSIKAYNYGADDYGMKKYVIAYLKKGPNRDLDSAEAFALQKGHMDNIGKMADAGKLVLAGPFLDNGDVRGIYIFNVETIEEAKSLTETDPAIQAGSLVMELVPWYGSAALVGVNDEHKRLAKINI